MSYMTVADVHKLLDDVFDDVRKESSGTDEEWATIRRIFEKWLGVARPEADDDRP